MLALYGRPDLGTDLGQRLPGYRLRRGMLFTAVTLFCSSLTRSQVVAAALSAAILFLITIVPYVVGRPGHPRQVLAGRDRPGRLPPVRRLQQGRD